MQYYLKVIFIIYVLLFEIYFIPFDFYAPQDFVCVLCDILNIVNVNCLKCPLLMKYVLTWRNVYKIFLQHC